MTVAVKRREMRKQLMFAVTLLLATVTCSADEPYLEAWAIRGESFTRNFPDVTEKLYEGRGYWGGEVIGRVPLGRIAVFGRVTTEGAAGGHSFQDPGTWTRLVGEGGLSYRILNFADGLESPVDEFEMKPIRYTCGVFGGYGISEDIQRGRLAPIIEDERNEQNGPPAKWGGGLHCRDVKLKMWANMRAEWDEAVGPGAHFAFTLHLPAFGERAGFGIDAVFGQYTKIQLQAKVLLFQAGGGK